MVVKCNTIISCIVTQPPQSPLKTAFGYNVHTTEDFDIKTFIKHYYNCYKDTSFYICLLILDQIGMPKRPIELQKYGAPLYAVEWIGDYVVVCGGGNLGIENKCVFQS